MWELYGVGCHVIMSRVLTQCTEVYKVLMKSSCLPPPYLFPLLLLPLPLHIQCALHRLTSEAYQHITTILWTGSAGAKHFQVSFPFFPLSSILSLFFLPSSLSDALLPSCLLFLSIPEERDNKTWWKLCNIQWCDQCTEGETGTREGGTERRWEWSLPQSLVGLWCFFRKRMRG